MSNFNNIKKQHLLLKTMQIQPFKKKKTTIYKAKETFYL